MLIYIIHKNGFECIWNILCFQLVNTCAICWMFSWFDPCLGSIHWYIPEHILIVFINDFICLCRLYRVRELMNCNSKSFVLMLSAYLMVNAMSLSRIWIFFSQIYYILIGARYLTIPMLCAPFIWLRAL